jgi:hypothetical protein
MIVEELFEKPLVRDINGVVKAEQLDSHVIYTELDEYVVTKELDRHFRHFLENYVSAIRNPNDPSIAGKVGVWVSGFFGSGKSHFIKILSYLLENLEVTDKGEVKTAYRFFENKVTDKMLLGDIHVAANQSTDVMLFNIDSRANTDDREDAILKVFIKVFNERLGYCSDHAHIAHMERILDEKNNYDRFKEVFQRENGSSWEAERDAWEFCQDEIITAFSEATGQSEESSRQTVENLESNFQLNIKNFSNWVNDYIESKGNHNVIFLVDEVGQFIGKNTQMMLKLQTITEELGTVCRGKAWVIVTSQADIDAVLGGMKSAGDSNDFSKIQGRFYTRISLSSSNTSEVIQKRLLDKTEPARERLNAFYADKGDILRNQLSFDKTTTAELESYEDSISFVDNYPFVPYHYPLLQKVFESIRTKGATGKHLAMGERSLLDAFQSAAKQIKGQEVGVLVPMHCFYQPIEGFLEPAVKRTIDIACDLKKMSEFDTNTLKTLFLVRYVDVLKSTLDNLVTLAVDRIDTDKIALKKEIEQTLNKLEQEMLIARNGDEYIFLTNEEKEIENEIRNIDVEASEQTKELSNIIFDDILARNIKYRYPGNQQDFKVSRFCNGHPRDGSMLEDLVVKVVSPIDINYGEYSDPKCKEMSREGDGSIVIKLADKLKLWGELSSYVKTARFLNLNSGQRPEQETLLREKANENVERKKRLRHGFEELFQTATFSVIGDDHTPKSATPSTMIKACYSYVIENTFSKLKLLKTTPSEVLHELRAVLNADDIAQTGLDLNDEGANPEAVREIDTFITMKTELNQSVYVRDLTQHFSKRPFGWPDNEILLLLARLALAGKVELTHQSALLALDKAYEPLTSVKKRNEIRVKKRKQIGDEQLNRAIKITKQLFNKTIPGSSEKELDVVLRAELNRRKQALIDFNSKSETGYYPGKKEIASGVQLVEALLEQGNSYNLIQKLIDSAKELEDFVEDFEDLDDFYNKQFNIWKALEQALNQEFSLNWEVLEKDDKAADALHQLDSIYQNKSPYGQIRLVNGLIEQVREINSEQLQQKRLQAAEKINVRIAQVTEQLDEVQAPPELRNRSLKSLQDSIKKIEETPAIYQVITVQSNSKDLEDEAYDAINHYIEQQQPQSHSNGSRLDNKEPAAPAAKKITTIRPATVAGESVLMIETQEEVEQYLQQLKERLTRAIDAGERVRIQ